MPPEKQLRPSGLAFCYNPPFEDLSTIPMRLNPGQQHAVEFVTDPARCWQERVLVKPQLPIKCST
ncbi:hypothetical protein KCP70_11795 [Salmonella enterica subsp. enterica]|nr:hypothetical protein KCP70_11795 [Salmonella enterica subsp. enterica]